MNGRLTSGMLLATALFIGCGDRDLTTQTFALNNIAPQSARALVEPYVPAGSAAVRVSDAPPAITVSAPHGRLVQIEEMLRRLDAAPGEAQLRFQLIEADGFTDTDPAIADVESALRELFRFEGYRLVAEAMVTTTQYSTATQQFLGFGETPLYLEVNIGQLNRSGSASSVHLSVRLGSPGSPHFLSTSVVVPGGQTVVLGTARPFQDRGALILVVRPVIK